LLLVELLEWMKEGINGRMKESVNE
jgi:hypothetical protein